MEKQLLKLFLLFLIFSSTSFPQDERETILYYYSDIKINKDASMTVTETIKVKAMGIQIKHGIYRDFPTKYKDKLGNNIIVDMKILEIKRNGFTEDYHTEKISNGIRIYIGNKDIYLNPGIYTYTISYETNRQLGFFKDHDELYWNVTGNGWDFQIDEAAAIITLPEHTALSELKSYGFTGPSGSTERNLKTQFLAPGRVGYKTTHPLLEREGLTVILEFPKGIVIEPSDTEKLKYFLNDNIGGIAGTLGLAALLIYYLLAWWRVGKDPAKDIIIPLYTPPDNLSPASIRFITRMGFDNKTFAAAVINMAVKGYLTIKEKEDKFILMKKMDDTSILSNDEKKIAEKLIFTKGGNSDYQIKQALAGLKKFSAGGNFFTRKVSSILESAIESKIEAEPEMEGKENCLEMDNKNHSVFREAIDALRKQLKNSYEKTYFLTNRKYFGFGVLISFVFIIISFLFSEVESIFILIWLLGWTTGVIFLAIMVVKSWQNVLAGKRVKFTLIGSAVFITLFAIPFVLGEFAGFYFLYTATSPFMVFNIGAIGLTNLLFYNLLKAPTLLGRKILDKIEGFKRYLSTAEKDRLNYIAPAEESPETFEKYLPYTLALNVEQEWAEKFSGTIEKAAAEKGYSPSWYSGSSWSALSAGSFVSSFGSSFSSAVSSSSTAPGSSSGSGGSSGGGGGGGGGGGW
ncbi:MAG TPA: DUF2207 domain-containing protein [Ignavibacteriaceae bacterium]|nr:DUF2207 domain-containing protein [Ignavibacteriaceae bacterium]